MENGLFRGLSCNLQRQGNRRVLTPAFDRFPVELQLIHKSDDGNIAVVAIMYDYGHPDAFLLQV